MIMVFLVTRKVMGRAGSGLRSLGLGCLWKRDWLLGV